jgi:16S rRNA (guanine527-N7)-methyltransferase
MNKDEFIKQVKELGIDITTEELNKLDKYYNHLIEYNKHTNLTAITEEKDVYLKHFYDSLTIVKAYKFKDEKVLDIGTGAGFPGIILKIFFPSLEMTLLDSNNKKIKFLEEIIDILELKNIKTINSRAEEYIKEKREYFDVVTSRAVANLTTLSEISLPFTKINGYFIPLKGGNLEEIIDAEYAIKELGGLTEKDLKLVLPIENSNRNILMIKKVKATDKKYPRQYNQILKNPLKKKVK